MNLKKLSIRPLQGFGELDFGASMEEIIEIMGQPEDSEVLSDGDEEVETLLWYYYKNGITLFIEGAEHSVLSNCETDNDQAILFGNRVFEMLEDEIIQLMVEHGYTKYEVEEETWGEKRITFEDAQTDFYFEREQLVTVNWGVIVDNNGKIQP